MTLLSISIITLIVFSIIAVISALRARNQRARLIDAAKNRARPNASEEISVSSFGIIREEPIPFDTSLQGLEVADLSESQAQMIRLIFEEPQRVVIIKNHREDYWATTEPSSL